MRDNKQYNESTYPAKCPFNCCSSKKKKGRKRKREGKKERKRDQKKVIGCIRLYKREECYRVSKLSQNRFRGYRSLFITAILRVSENRHYVDLPINVHR